MCFALKGKSPQFRWDTPFIASPQNEALFQFKILKLTGFLTVFFVNNEIKIALFVFILFIKFISYSLRLLFKCNLIMLINMTKNNAFYSLQNKISEFIIQTRTSLNKRIITIKTRSKEVNINSPPLPFSYILTSILTSSNCCKYNLILDSNCNISRNKANLHT